MHDPAVRSGDAWRHSEWKRSVRAGSGTADANAKCRKKRHSIGNRTLAHARTAVNGDWHAGKRGGGHHESRGGSAIAKIDVYGDRSSKSTAAPVNMYGIAGHSDDTTERSQRFDQTVRIVGTQCAVQY